MMTSLCSAHVLQIHIHSTVAQKTPRVSLGIVTTLAITSSVKAFTIIRPTRQDAFQSILKKRGIRKDPQKQIHLNSNDHFRGKRESKVLKSRGNNEVYNKNFQ